MKNILRKIACGIKTLYSLRELISDNYKILTLHALVISHLLHSAVLLNGIKNNLLTSIKKQLISGVKACFRGKKYDSSLDLKIKTKFYRSGLFRSKINLSFLESSLEKRISYTIINKTRRVKSFFPREGSKISKGQKYQNSIHLFRKLRIQAKYNNL